MTTQLERSRLTVGGLLIVASLAIGAGSDRWILEPPADAPVLPVMDAMPLATARPAADHVPAPQRAGADAAPRTPEAEASVEPFEKEAAIEPADAPAPDAAPAVEEALLVMEGSASWYADALAGRRTASGEPYDPSELIAAHRALPFGTRLRVTNLANDRTVEVRVIDRGPFVAGRVLDLSRSAAEQIGIVRAGHGRVRIEVLEYGG